MELIGVSEASKKWNMSERMVRNYCQEGRICGAIKRGKTWLIPFGATKPERKNGKNTSYLLSALKSEMEAGVSGGIYHKVQIELTYNSNHIEGSTLTSDQTRYIFETNTIGISGGVVRVDDVVETANHFKCVKFIIENATQNLTEEMIKKLHLWLKNGTSDSFKDWFMVGEYKKLPNEVGGNLATSPQMVKKELVNLINAYNKKENKTLEDIIDFHYRFEKIHPFQDGNGRVGRLIMFKECLKHNIVPFIIDENHKLFYYRGLTEWEKERGYLMDTCLSCQDKFKIWLKYFNIEF